MGVLGGDSSQCCGSHGIGIFGEDSALEAGLGGLPGFEAVGDLFVGDFDRQFAIGNVEGDGVAFADGGDRSADGRLRSDVAGREAARRAGETPIGEQRNRVGQLRDADDGGGNLSISRMPGPPLGPS